MLPLLREEIRLLPGPILADGQPSWTLHDPGRNLFFQVDWITFEILSRWSLGSPAAISEAVAKETTLSPETDQVAQVVSFMAENQLLRPTGDSANAFAQRLKKTRGGIGQWLLHNYLFFRIPLVRPDRWLERWSPVAALFASRGFRIATLFALLFGLSQIFRLWDTFSATLVDMLSWQGLLGYGIALTGVKMLHELGHAFTARHYGCRVPSMGLAFLVMWPVAYTDTNEVWKLTDRWQRFRVAAAGIVTELHLAAWATCAWAFLPDGQARNLAFLIATSTWISTLAINASPFMRFDGYFLVSDWVGMPNLHNRAFALARWDLRKRLFALDDPLPEAFPARQHAALVLFGWLTWIYRLTLFLGIAALVYHFFIKAVGIFLFAVEIGWFVFLPCWREVTVWRARWSDIRGNRRTWYSAGLAVGFSLLFVVPWPTRIQSTGLLRPAEQMAIYAPSHARLASLPASDRYPVAAGDVLLELDSPDLDLRQDTGRSKLARLRQQADAAGFDREQRAQLLVLREQVSMAEAELANLDADRKRYAIVAPYSATFHIADPDLRPGDWVSRNELIGTLAQEKKLQIISYLPEEDVARIRVGDSARFYPPAHPESPLPLVITAVDRDASRQLHEPTLATVHGGDVLCREKNGLLFPERAVYKVSYEVEAASLNGLPLNLRGSVVTAGASQIPGERFIRSALAVLRREAGF